MSELDDIIKQAEAILAMHNIAIPPKAPKPPKEGSIKKKKQPVIKSGAQYHYDPATYDELHKVSNWHLVDTEQRLVDLVDYLMNTKRCYLAIDTETKPLTQYNALTVPEHIIRRYVKKHPNDVPFAIGLSDGINAWFITCEEHFNLLKPVLEREDTEKLLANAKYDLHELENIHLYIKGRIHDVQTLVKLYNENYTSYRLKDLAVRFIDKQANKYEIMKDNWMAENRTKDWTAVPKKLMADYGCGDVWYTYVIFEKILPYMTEFELTELYDTECALIPIAYRMERLGFKINREYLETLKPEFEKEIDDMKTEIYAMAGRVLNVNSGPQLLDFFLSNGLTKADIAWNEETGNPIFDKDEMEKLAKRFSVVYKIQELKRTEKLLSSYVVNILNQLPRHNRVHGSINTMEAVTGRMSITDPALQTLPKKDKRIRRAFIPKEGCALFFFDLDQIEYRGFAHYSKDENLIQSIRNGWDVHRATAAIIYNKDYNDVTEDERSRAKTINFALIYGVGIDHLAEMLDVTPVEARYIKRQYFDKLPKAEVFINSVQQITKERGYVRNSFMRRRRLTKDEVYKAPNALLQSWAADFIKQKMRDLGVLLQDYCSEMVNVVHDELIFEIPYNEIETIVPLIKATIDDLTSFRVPITCGCEWSLLSWGDKMDYDMTKTLEENRQIFVEKYPQVGGLKVA